MAKNKQKFDIKKPKYTIQDLQTIAAFNKIIKNYTRMCRLLEQT